MNPLPLLLLLSPFLIVTSGFDSSNDYIHDDAHDVQYEGLSYEGHEPALQQQRAFLFRNQIKTALESIQTELALLLFKASIALSANPLSTNPLAKLLKKIEEFFGRKEDSKVISSNDVFNIGNLLANFSANQVSESSTKITKIDTKELCERMEVVGKVLDLNQAIIDDSLARNDPKSIRSSVEPVQGVAAQLAQLAAHSSAPCVRSLNRRMVRMLKPVYARDSAKSGLDLMKKSLGDTIESLESAGAASRQKRDSPLRKLFGGLYRFENSLKNLF